MPLQAPGGPRTHQEAPRGPRRPQEDPGSPRRHQEDARGPRRTQEAPGGPRRTRRSQETPGTMKCQEAQDAPRGPMRKALRAHERKTRTDNQEAPGRPRRPQEAPRGRKRPPRRTQEAPGSPRRPRRPQETPGTMKRQEAQGPQGRVRSVAIELVLEIDVRISDYGYRYISSCSDVRLRCSRSSTNTRTFCVGARPCELHLRTEGI